MKELFGLFAQIAISRKGPQDLPASYFLLGLTVLGYWVIRYVLSLLMPPAGGSVLSRSVLNPTPHT